MPFRIVPVTIHLSVREWVTRPNDTGGPLGPEIAKRLMILAQALANAPNQPYAGDTWETHTSPKDAPVIPEHRYIVQIDAPDRKPS